MRGCGCVRCTDSATQIASDPHQPNIRETNSTVLGDEDIPLQRRKLHCLGTGVGILPLSSCRGRALCYAGTEDRVRRPPAANGLNGKMGEAEHSTCQFQRISPEVFPQVLDDTAIFHPRRHHGTCFIIHPDPDKLQYVGVGQALPRYDLPAKILQTIRLSHDENRSKSLTFFTFRISPDS